MVTASEAKQAWIVRKNVATVRKLCNCFFAEIGTQSIEKGTIPIPLSTGQSISVRDVYYVPAAHMNILSAGRLGTVG